MTIKTFLQWVFIIPLSNKLFRKVYKPFKQRKLNKDSFALYLPLFDQLSWAVFATYLQQVYYKVIMLWVL